MSFQESCPQFEVLLLCCVVYVYSACCHLKPPNLLYDIASKASILSRASICPCVSVSMQLSVVALAFLRCLLCRQDEALTGASLDCVHK